MNTFTSKWLNWKPKKQEGATDKTDKSSSVSLVNDTLNSFSVKKLTPEQKENFEERSAIREYEGNMPREEAEKEALLETIEF